MSIAAEHMSMSMKVICCCIPPPVNHVKSWLPQPPGCSVAAWGICPGLGAIPLM